MIPDSSLSTVVYEEVPRVPFDDFLPELTLDMPEVPDAVLMNYIRSACIEFSERTRILGRRIVIKTQSCVPSYILDTDGCERIIFINRVFSCACSIRYPVLSGSHNLPGCRGFFWERPDTLWISPAPSVADEIIIDCSVVPDISACEVDEVLLNSHKEAIQAGARARLYSLPRRPWSDASMSLEMRNEFDRRISSAGATRLMRGVTGALHMRGIWSSCGDIR